MADSTKDQIEKAELSMLRRLFAEIIGPLDYHIQAGAFQYADLGQAD